MKNKKIRVGENLNSFLVPITLVGPFLYKGAVSNYQGVLVYVIKVNILTAVVRLCTNNPIDYIEYEVKDL